MAEYSPNKLNPKRGEGSGVRGRGLSHRVALRVHTPRYNNSTPEKGFSLVELLVALLFTLLLMAGMAAVFKASLASFYTSGENLSNTRRNRMSIDLLGDDINLACMYLTDIALPPPTLPSVPPFYIIPNVAIANAGENDPQKADELYFYMDEPLSFEGELISAPSYTASDLVALEDVNPGYDYDAIVGAASGKYVVNCPSVAQAQQVAAAHEALRPNGGVVAIIRDRWEALYATDLRIIEGASRVEFYAGASPDVGITGLGSSGLPSEGHIPGSLVTFVKPAQMIRYRVAMLELDPDPDKPEGRIPCLVREQGVYKWDGSDPFNTPGAPQIITENVTGFKVYLSVNGGSTDDDWAGMDISATGFAAWDQGIRGKIDSKLATAGRPGYQDTRGSEHWFRNIPTLVRVDLTTRTAAKRAEFSELRNQLAYRELKQSLIFVPRHFGLPMR